MDSNLTTTVDFRSNLYPVTNSCMSDAAFQAQVHDPFSLEALQKHCRLTPLQKQEYSQASLHCAYAAPDDYPWGTILNEDGCKQVVCKCLNTKCRLFDKCRPDFNPSELAIYDDNRLAQPAIFKFDANVMESQVAVDGDAEAAATLFSDSVSGKERTDVRGVIKETLTLAQIILPLKETIDKVMILEH